MKTIHTAITFIAIVLAVRCTAQPKSRAECIFVDSFYLNSEKTDKVYVGFDKPRSKDPIDESVIMRVRGGKETYYYKVLACYACSGHNLPGGTYGGHVKRENVVAFIQRFTGWLDTVYIDFSSDPPVFAKYVHTSEIDPEDQYTDYPKMRIPISEYSIYNGGNKKYANAFRTVYLRPKRKAGKTK